MSTVRGNFATCCLVPQKLLNNDKISRKTPLAKFCSLLVCRVTWRLDLMKWILFERALVDV